MRLRTYDRFYPYPVIGIDEVGTGAIAGPIYAAGVVLPRSGAVLDALEKLNLNDSKQMSEGGRYRVYQVLTENPEVRWWVGKRFPYEIEAMGHYEAIASIFNEILGKFREEYPEDGSILIDGQRNAGVPYAANWIEKGDTRSMSIAAASVLAKWSRDSHMIEIGEDFPEYSFREHKGYLTKAHKEELEKYGACDAHRKTTQPVREAIARRTSRP